eukprot:TRINITY_DN100_c0_g1_i1.p1 TRINITY_DN100_c0_g1~~TRINITY_DN100_c0_g1_i1.p1  ORF type:complete len:3677 (-),score=773.68 TRINITY_DN100_c0_g1_i1:96-11126(-)
MAHTNIIALALVAVCFAVIAGGQTTPVVVDEFIDARALHTNPSHSTNHMETEFPREIVVYNPNEVGNLNNRQFPDNNAAVYRWASDHDALTGGIKRVLTYVLTRPSQVVMTGGQEYHMDLTLLLSDKWRNTAEDIRTVSGDIYIGITDGTQVFGYYARNSDFKPLLFQGTTSGADGDLVVSSQFEGDVDLSTHARPLTAFHIDALLKLAETDVFARGTSFTKILHTRMNGGSATDPLNPFLGLKLAIWVGTGDEDARAVVQGAVIKLFRSNGEGDAFTPLHRFYTATMLNDASAAHTCAACTYSVQPDGAETAEYFSITGVPSQPANTRGVLFDLDLGNLPPLSDDVEGYAIDVAVQLANDTATIFEESGFDQLDNPNTPLVGVLMGENFAAGRVRGWPHNVNHGWGFVRVGQLLDGGTTFQAPRATDTGFSDRCKLDTDIDCRFARQTDGFGLFRVDSYYQLQIKAMKLATWIWGYTDSPALPAIFKTGEVGRTLNTSTDGGRIRLFIGHERPDSADDIRIHSISVTVTTLAARLASDVGVPNVLEMLLDPEQIRTMSLAFQSDVTDDLSGQPHPQKTNIESIEFNDGGGWWVEFRRTQREAGKMLEIPLIGVGELDPALNYQIHIQHSITQEYGELFGDSGDQDPGVGLSNGDDVLGFVRTDGINNHIGGFAVRGVDLNSTDVQTLPNMDAMEGGELRFADEEGDFTPSFADILLRFDPENDYTLLGRIDSVTRHASISKFNPTAAGTSPDDFDIEQGLALSWFANDGKYSQDGALEDTELIENYRFYGMRVSIREVLAPNVIIDDPDTFSVEEAGQVAVYTIRLTAAPTQNVVVEPIPEDTTYGLMTPASVTFTPGDWQTPKTVTVEATDDARDEGTTPLDSVMTHTVTTNDVQYTGLVPRSLTFQVTDDDTAGFTMGSVVGSVTENTADQASYTISLTSEPLPDKNVTVTIHVDGQLVLDSAAEIVFTDTDYAAKTVLVSASDDDVVEGTHTGTVTHTLTTDDLLFQAAAAELLPRTVTVNDDDIAGVTVSNVSPSVIQEPFGDPQHRGTYTLTLNARPASGSVSISMAGDSDVLVETTSPVVFTPVEWDTLKTVTVVAIDDDLIEADELAHVSHTVTSGDVFFDGVTTSDATVTVESDDVANVTISAAVPSLIKEGELTNPGVYSVVLDAIPESDVTIHLTISPESVLVATATHLIFTDQDWDSAQLVSVVATNDLIFQGNSPPRQEQVAHSISTNDPNFGALTQLTPVIFTITDIDKAGISRTVFQNASEDIPTAGIFTVVLDSKPTDSVTILLTDGGVLNPGGVSEIASIVPPDLVFTSLTWDTPLSASVTPLDDLFIEAPSLVAVDLASSSNDLAYDGELLGVSLYIEDDDTASVVVGTPTVSTLDEANPALTSTYTVYLTAETIAGVDILLSGSQFTMNPSILSFATGQAGMANAQTVTVTVVDDDVVEAPLHTGTIDHTLVTVDPNYSPLSVSSVSLDIVDNDVAGLSVATNDVTEGGSNVDLVVTLTSQPVDVVNVTATTPDGQVQVVGSALVQFNDLDWNMPHTIVVSAVDDALVEGDHSGDVVFTPTSDDPNYSAPLLGPTTESLVVHDNDVASVEVSKLSLQVVEGGATDSFSVTLGSEPFGDVTVSISSLDTTRATVSPGSIVFDNTNYDDPGVGLVTVTAVDNQIDDGDTTVNLQVEASASGPDLPYQGLQPATQPSVDVTDNDDAAVIVSAVAPNTVSEALQDEATFTVVLDTDPTVDVTVTFTEVGEAPHTDDITVTCPSSLPYLLFNSLNWFVPQACTITAVDDDFLENASETASVTFTSATLDPLNPYNSIGITPASLSVTSDDVAGVTISPINYATGDNMTEGETATFTVVLDAIPDQDVSITIVPESQLSFDLNPVVFACCEAGNWDQPQTVVVTAVDDQIVQGTHTATIDFGSSSDEAAWNGLVLPSRTVTILDNDVPGVSLAEKTDAVEGVPDSGSVTVTLTASPGLSSLVTVLISEGTTLNFLGENQIQALNAETIFADGNWDTIVTVNFTATDDLAVETSLVPPREHTGTLVMDATSDNAFFVETRTIDVTILDDDLPGLSLNPGSVTAQEGGTEGVFNVVLPTAPDGTVVIDIASLAPGDATLSQSSVSFTSADWDVAVPITVTAVDDMTVEGPETTSVDLSLNDATGVTGWDGATALVAGTVTVNLLDNDVAGFSVDPATLSVTEGSGTVSLSVELDKQPLTDVNINLLETVVASRSQLTLSESTLTFTFANWNQPQTVEVGAVDDNVVETSPMTRDIALSVETLDTEWGNVPDETVVVSITDNDPATLTVSAPGQVNEPGTDSTTVTVALSSRPQEGTTVQITATADSQVQANPTVLTFDFSDTPLDTQQVVIRAQDDPFVEGTHTGTISWSVTSTDSLWTTDPSDTVVTVGDDDTAGITVTQNPATTLVEGGATSGIYGLRLTAQPTADVVISVLFDADQLDVTPTQLTFVPNLWNIAQLVTVFALDDLIDETSPHSSTVEHSAESTDNNFDIDEADAPSFEFTILDNDAANLTLSSATTAEEGGLPSIFTVTLSTEPADAFIVTVNIASGGTLNPIGEEEIETPQPTTLQFDSSDWNIPKEVTITAYDDDVDEPAGTALVQLTTASDDPFYASMAGISEFVNIPITDNDDAGITGPTVVPATLDEDDLGITASVSFSLQTTPIAPVTITASDPLGQVSFTPSQIVRTVLNDVATFVVRAVDDSFVEISPHTTSTVYTFTSGDPSYTGVFSVDFDILDNDEVDVIIDIGTALAEGNTRTFPVVLDHLAPDTFVTAEVTPLDPDYGVDVVTGGSTRRSVREVAKPSVIDAIRNAQTPEERRHLLESCKRSGPTDIVGVVVPDGAIPNMANPTDAFSNPLITSDGRTLGLSLFHEANGVLGGVSSPLVLGSPVDAIEETNGQRITLTPTIGVSSINVAEIGSGWTTWSHGYTDFVFTAGAASPVEVGVEIVPPDGVDAFAFYVEPNQFAVFQIVVEANDSSVASMQATLSQSVEGDAGAAIFLFYTIGSSDIAKILVLSEDAAAGYALGEFHLHYSTLAFPSDVPQEFVLRAVDDLRDEGVTHPAEFQITLSSNNPRWDTYTETFQLSILDNDVANVTTTEIKTDTTEGDLGDCAAFSVVLDTEPVSGVTILASSGDGQLFVSTPMPLIFLPTSGNWDVAQTVTVCASDDSIPEIIPHFASIDVAVQSADPYYQGFVVPALIFSVTEIQTAGLVVTPDVGVIQTVDEDHLQLATYDVVLTSQPTGIVTVDITSTNSQAEISTPESSTFATVNSVLFDSTNWVVPQTVTVRAVDDLVVEAEDHAAPISFVISSSYGSFQEDRGLLVDENDQAQLEITGECVRCAAQVDVQTFIFNVNVTNLGPGIVEGVGFDFALTFAATYDIDGDPAAPCTIDTVNDLVTCSFGTMNPGDVGSWQITGTPLEGGLFDITLVAFGDVVGRGPQATVPLTIQKAPNAIGDPHFEGFYGGGFDVMGTPGVVFNLLSDKNIQVNARFISYPEYYVGTFMGAVGILAGPSRILVNSTGYTTLNGQDVVPGKKYLLEGGGMLEIPEGGTLVVKFDAYIVTVSRFVFEHLEGFSFLEEQIKLDPQLVFADGVAPHGIIGQTANKKVVVHSHGHQGEGVLEGTYHDYEVEDGIFGTKFRFNRFEKP